MAVPRTYPQGVTCWIDTEQPDPDAAARFYGELFGWELADAMPSGAPGSYLVATLDGQDVAAIAPAATGPAAWNTYIAVDDVDATAAEVTARGGALRSGPVDAGPGGRWAGCVDPTGAGFRLWQARRRLGAQLANVPGAWNFSDLYTTDRDAAVRFYVALFGWKVIDVEGAGSMIQVPGFGDHLQATSDPDIRKRQAGAPPGFADVIGGLAEVDAGQPSSWRVTFTVEDRDAAAATAERLGADIVAVSDDMWTRNARIRDPQGADFSISQFSPPESF